MSKIEVGSKVRVASRTAWWFDQSGVVAEILPTAKFSVFVDLDDGGQVAFRESELELTTPPTTADLVAANDAEFVARLERKQAAKEAVKESEPEPLADWELELLGGRRAVILRTAEKLINGQRAKDCGEPKENFGRIADLWNAQFGRKLKAPFTAGDVALALVHLKLSRLANTPDHEDSFVDACGYLALGAEIAEGL